MGVEYCDPLHRENRQQLNLLEDLVPLLPTRRPCHFTGTFLWDEEIEGLKSVRLQD